MTNGADAMGFNAKFTNNAPKFLNELDGREVEIANEWGKLWQSVASKLLTKSGAVDTGRLRASLSYITYSGSGSKLSSVSESQGGDTLSGRTSQRTELVVGSNVSYASLIEIGNNGVFARPYVLPAIARYKNQYAKLTEQILKRK